MPELNATADAAGLRDRTPIEPPAPPYHPMGHRPMHKLDAADLALLARTMRGYADAQARNIYRDLIDMPATVEVDPAGVVVRFHRRAHLPIVIASGLLDKPVAVPWWNHLPLRLTA